MANKGRLQVGVTKEELKEILKAEQNNVKQEKLKYKRKFWKGLMKNEKKSDE